MTKDRIPLAYPRPRRDAYVPHPRVSRGDWGPSMTKSEFAEECDINRIMDQFMTTGLIDHVAKQRGQYADLTAMDFQQAMDVIADAHSQFETLPSKLRSQFDNDPQKFLQYMENATDQDLRSLGLVRDNYPASKDSQPANNSSVPDPEPAQLDTSEASDAAD